MAPEGGCKIGSFLILPLGKRKVMGVVWGLMISHIVIFLTWFSYQQKSGRLYLHAVSEVSFFLVGIAAIGVFIFSYLLVISFVVAI